MTMGPYAAVGRGDYLKALWDRCLEKRALDVYYLSPIDLDNPFSQAMKVYNNRRKAFRECEMILNNLQNLADSYENLRIYFSPNPYGLDIILPERNVPEDLYMFIRDNRMNITGGIHIKNRDIGCRAKETFNMLCSHAVLLRGDAAVGVIEQKKRELRKRYSR